MCRKCSKTGDAIDYVMMIKGLDFVNACRELGIEFITRTQIQIRQNGSYHPPNHNHMLVSNRLQANTGQIEKNTVVKPPCEQWQKQARFWIEQAEQQLWEPGGNVARSYLHRRGFNDNTIRAARLGWIPSPVTEPGIKWGIDQSVFVDSGIVIPWFIKGMHKHEEDVWRLNIRRKGDSGPKYRGPAGFKQGLYGGDAISTRKPVVMVEGEFNALSVQQEARDLVTAVATGGTHAGICSLWIVRLMLAPVVLIAFDNDQNEAGEVAARVWEEKLPHAKRWRPTRSDVNEMLQSKCDIRKWVQSGLRYAQRDLD